MNASRSLRILMLGPSFSVKGGISSVEKSIHRGLTDRNHRVMMLPTTFDHPRLLKLVHGLVLWCLFPFILLLTRPRIVYIHFASSYSTWRKRPFVTWSWLFRRKVILHAHGGGYEAFWNGLRPRKRRRILRMFSRSERLIVLSEVWKRFYAETVMVDEYKIRILPNPVSVRVEHPRQHEDHEILKLYYCGRVTPEKGLSEVVDALSLLDESTRSRLEFHVFGDGEIESIRRRAERLGVDSLLKFHGWVDQKDLEVLRKEMDVFVLASHIESMPMSLLEAMAHGHAIITTGVGSIPEVIEDDVNGIIVEIKDSSSLSDAFHRMLADLESRQRLGVCAATHSRRYDIDDYVDEIVNLIRG